jgi:hypothetical protein
MMALKISVRSISTSYPKAYTSIYKLVFCYSSNSMYIFFRRRLTRAARLFFSRAVTPAPIETIDYG